VGTAALTLLQCMERLVSVVWWAAAAVISVSTALGGMYAAEGSAHKASYT
jgi:hypothetical protein